MALIAADVNATRIRVLQGMSPREGRAILLEGHEADLPLSLNLEGRSPVVGRAGLTLCRRSPHLSCTGFLPHLGENREWTGRCRVDATLALSAAFDHVGARAGKHNAAAIAVPGYLLDDQRDLLQRTAEKSRLKVFGTIDTALASALTAHSQQAWEGIALLADVDDHALTWSAVSVAEGAAETVHYEPHVSLGSRLWRERLLESLANACVLRSRRDPRDSAEAEQALFDQLEGLMQAARENRPAEVSLTSPWTLTLIVNALDTVNACRGLVGHTLSVFQHVVRAVEPEPIQTVLLTASAARLPGLVAAVEFAATSLAPETVPIHVRVLSPDAAAAAALELASRWHHGSLTPGHLYSAPVLEAHAPGTGPARVHYRGLDHPFRSTVFEMGRDQRCDLVFETAEYPSVSGKHCKIVSERGGFVLYDLSRHGTLVNERPVVEQKALEPGDWIRLGPGGPLLRFLGHTLDQRKLMPTA